MPIFNSILTAPPSRASSTMSTFKYRAFDTNGTTVKGILEADSQSSARQVLRDRKLAPLDVAPASQYASKVSLKVSNAFKTPIRPKQIALFTQQLSTMLGAGVPLVQALDFVAIRSPKHIGALFFSIKGKVMEGESFSFALSQHPGVFGPMYLASVEAGERAGALDAVLVHLADYLEARVANQRQITSALLYPIILLIASAAVITLLMTSVMPGFIEIFEQNNQRLPPLTIFVVSTFEFIKRHVAWITMCLMLTTYLFQQTTRSTRSQRKLDVLILRIPFVGSFIKNRSAEDVSRTLFILGSSGVQLVEALRISLNIVSNSQIQQQLSVVADDVSQGVGFAKALEKASTVPSIMVQLVESGEASGQLDQVLEKVAGVLHTETQSSLTTLIGLIEPLILVLVSGVIFTIVTALLQPIFELNSFI